jgi:hypothetical protein
MPTAFFKVVTHIQQPDIAIFMSALFLSVILPATASYFFLSLAATFFFCLYF